MKTPFCRIFYLLLSVFCLFAAVACAPATIDGDLPTDGNTPVVPKEIVLAAKTLVFPENSAFAATFPQDESLLGGIPCALPGCSNAYLNGLIQDAAKSEIARLAPQGSVGTALDFDACYKDENLYSFAFCYHYDSAAGAREMLRFYLSADFEHADILSLGSIVKTAYFTNGTADQYLAAYLADKFAGQYDSEKAASYKLSPESTDHFYVAPGGVKLVFSEEIAIAGKLIEVYIGNAALLEYKRSGQVSTEAPAGGYKETYAPAKEGEKVVAMTFDDGPGGASTDRLLDYLIANNFKATFFVNSNNCTNVENDTIAQNQLIRMAQSGMEIGNHSYSHAYFNKLSAQQRAYQIDHNQEIIENVCGVSPVTFRAAGGIFHEGMEQASRYFYIDWSVDKEDYLHTKDGDGGAAVAAAYLGDIGSGDIVLMHNIYENSVSAAITIMNSLNRQGYRFVTVSELLDLQNKVPDGTIYLSQNATRQYRAYEK